MKKIIALTLFSSLILSGCLKQDVSITTINQDKEVIEGAAVTIEDSKGNRISLQSNAQGMSHPSLKKGDYKITLNKTDCEAKYEEVNIQVTKETKNFITELNCK